MKIYVITKGFYDDYEILAVTTDKDQADKYKESVDDGTDDYRVEEYEDLASFCGWGKLPWCVSYDPGTGDYVATISDSSCESQKFDTIRMIPGYTDLTVYVYVLAPDSYAAKCKGKRLIEEHLKEESDKNG